MPVKKLFFFYLAPLCKWGSQPTFSSTGVMRGDLQRREVRRTVRNSATPAIGHPLKAAVSAMWSRGPGRLRRAVSTLCFRDSQETSSNWVMSSAIPGVQGVNRSEKSYV